jgi:hypothetical protein
MSTPQDSFAQVAKECAREGSIALLWAMLPLGSIIAAVSWHSEIARILKAIMSTIVSILSFGGHTWWTVALCVVGIISSAFVCCILEKIKENYPLIARYGRKLLLALVLTNIVTFLGMITLLNHILVTTKDGDLGLRVLSVIDCAAFFVSLFSIICAAVSFFIFWPQTEHSIEFTKRVYGDWMPHKAPLGNSKE